MLVQQCIKCGIYWPLNENYYIFEDGLLRFGIECKPCKRIKHQQYPSSSKEYKATYRRKLRASDPLFKLREIVSSRIGGYLKTRGSRKECSIKKVLPYTMDELKAHLESQFEDWMTWENWGRYRVDTWDDNDSGTWTWQIDHIIPHCKFNYLSLYDDTFQECWSLDNLRPLSSKLNALKGSNLTA